MMNSPIDKLTELERLAKQCRLSVVEQQGKFHDLVRALIDWRLEARKSKNFEIADKLREILNERGIEIQDTKFGHGELMTDTYKAKYETDRRTD